MMTAEELHFLRTDPSGEAAREAGRLAGQGPKIVIWLGPQPTNEGTD